jgi:hypothetical protein
MLLRAAPSEERIMPT